MRPVLLASLWVAASLVMLSGCAAEHDSNPPPPETTATFYVVSGALFCDGADGFDTSGPDAAWCEWYCSSYAGGPEGRILLRFARDGDAWRVTEATVVSGCIPRA